MRLNPTRCKEIHINFLHNANFLINPIVIGGNVTVLTPIRSWGLLWPKTLSGMVMSSTLLRELVKSCIRLEYSTESASATPTF